MAGEAHFYGGQAVLEGVMMRGRDHWAIAVRRPDETIHVESHDIHSIGDRVRILRKPFLRGVIALGQALTIGLRALTISANQSVEEENQLTTGQMAASMALAFVIFTAVFIVGPFLGFHLLHNTVSSGVERNLLEGLVRVLLFLGYIALIGQLKEIRRVFEYHGAEHKTIAAYEHDEALVPENVDKYSTLHVRCGTNFLLIVMLLAILVYAFFPAKGILWGILSRVIAIPIIAGHLVRAAAPRRAVHRLGGDEGAHGARPVAAEDHDEAAGPRADRGGHRVVPGGAARGGRRGRRRRGRSVEHAGRRPLLIRRRIGPRDRAGIMVPPCPPTASKRSSAGTRS